MAFLLKFKIKRFSLLASPQKGRVEKEGDFIIADFWVKKKEGRRAFLFQGQG
jgi:hypothetical protein